MFALGYCRFYVELLKCEVIITLIGVYWLSKNYKKYYPRPARGEGGGGRTTTFKSIFKFSFLKDLILGINFDEILKRRDIIGLEISGHLIRQVHKHQITSCYEIGIE